MSYFCLSRRRVPPDGCGLREAERRKGRKEGMRSEATKKYKSDTI